MVWSLIKKNRFILYFLILLSYAGWVLFPYNYIEPELNAIVQDFRVKMWDKCPNSKIHSTWQVSIKFSNDLSWFDDDTIGMCLRKPLGFDIEILKKFWVITSDVSKRELLTHELLHCYLKIKHEPNTLMDEKHQFYKTDEELNKQIDYFLNKACDK